MTDEYMYVYIDIHTHIYYIFTYVYIYIHKYLSYILFILMHLDILYIDIVNT